MNIQPKWLLISAMLDWSPHALMSSLESGSYLLGVTIFNVMP